MAYHENKDIQLKRKDSGKEVEELQKELLKLGYQIGEADGKFGEKTEKAVLAFQEANFVTGIVDSNTAAAIHSKSTDKTAPPAALDIPFIQSPNFSSRKGRDVDMLVIHYTAGGSTDGTIRTFENPVVDASAHYVLGRDGKIVQMVKEEDKAWHAGKSQWGAEINCNNFSIGIEIVNWGLIEKKNGVFYCWPGEYTKKYTGPGPIKANGNFWQPYTEKQYSGLIQLGRGIIRRHNIPLKRVLGHSDIAPGRKNDPGPAFDWDRFKSGLA